LVTKRQFADSVADAMDLPRASLAPPYWLAWVVTWCCEKMAKLRGAEQAPNFNFTRFKFMAMNLDFSIDKARRELGYNPRVSFADAMAETMNWYKVQEGR
jgi:nucleoside-diphosphate-sugar epimerase